MITTDRKETENSEKRKLSLKSCNEEQRQKKLYFIHSDMSRYICLRIGLRPNLACTGRSPENALYSLDK